MKLAMFTSWLACPPAQTFLKDAAAHCKPIAQSLKDLMRPPLEQRFERESHEAYSAHEARYEALEARLMLRLGHPWWAGVRDFGIDLHRARAAELYGVPYELVSDEQRKVGKHYNTLELYGGDHGSR